MNSAEITEIGLQALRKCDGIDPAFLLGVEIYSRVSAVNDDDLADIVGLLLDKFGSPEAAVVALKTGKVKLG